MAVEVLYESLSVSSACFLFVIGIEQRALLPVVCVVSTGIGLSWFSLEAQWETGALGTEIEFQDVTFFSLSHT